MERKQVGVGWRDRRELGPSEDHCVRDLGVTLKVLGSQWQVLSRAGLDCLCLDGSVSAGRMHWEVQGAYWEGVAGGLGV